MSGISQVRNLIAAVIDANGGDSYESRLTRDGWVVNIGSTKGYIFLIEDEEDSDATGLHIGFKVMKVPLPKALPFYRKLLEINNGLGGQAAFAIDGENTVWLYAGRSIADISGTEINELLMYTAHTADYYDDILLDEFGRNYAMSD